jgi:DNA-binding IclR family transcriptional regulator
MNGDVQVRFCERRGVKLPPATLLERGLAILGCFTPQRPVLGIADIADELGMSRSTTHRYMITLLALGYIEQGASRKYRLGLRVTDLGMSALNSTGLREHSHPYLEELRQRTSYTVNLSVLDGSDILYVDRARSFRQGQARLTSACTRGRGCRRTARRWGRSCSRICQRTSGVSGSQT